MAGSSHNDDDVMSAINVTPLVDVTLVLLVIFLITAPVIYQSAIKVDLPKARTGQEQEKSPIEFTIDKNGKIFWDEKEVTWTDLEKQLKAMGSTVEGETAVISADQMTPHGTVVRLMDMLRQVGLVKFALNVESPRN